MKRGVQPTKRVIEPPPDAGRNDTELRMAIAHALRTPLTALSLGAGVLRSASLGPLAPAQREVVETLVREAERMDRALDALLGTARLGSYKGPEPTTASKRKPRAARKARR